MIVSYGLTGSVVDYYLKDTWADFPLCVPYSMGEPRGKDIPSRAQWKSAVWNEETQLGYWQWVQAQVDAQANEEHHTTIYQQ